MKKFMFILALAALPFLYLMSAATEAAEPVKKVEQPKGETLVVPKGKTYVKVDEKGKEIGRFTAGKLMRGVADCAQVPCPVTFGPDIVCWKCVERPKTNTQQ